MKYVFQVRRVQTPCIDIPACTLRGRLPMANPSFFPRRVGPDLSHQEARRFRETPNDAHDSVHAISAIVQ